MTDRFAHLPDNPESGYFIENAKLSAPRLRDMDSKSTNLCVTLRRKQKYRDMCLLPMEAFYPKGVPEEPPVETDPHRARSKRNYYAKGVPEAGKRKDSKTNRRYWAKNADVINAKRRERYATNKDYRELQKARQRKSWASRKDLVNETRRENYRQQKLREKEKTDE